MNYRLIAIQVGDLLKYDTTVNDVNRAAQSIFSFQCEHFPNDSITSSRAKLIHDWVLTLAKQRMNNEERNQKLISFLDLIAPESLKEGVNKILKKAGVVVKTEIETSKDFFTRNFHHEIHKHCSKLYSQGNYFHAVFEAAKVYNKKVQKKAQSNKDGQPLMMEAWAPSGVLKVTACKTETDRNIQEGIKFLSAGLMQAMRNPTAHEPALDWPISREDCLDMLSFISYLFKQLDNAVYFKLS
jgi:uncharacterized protein (TIGR02391 family)